ncbi:TFIID and SAGA subunit [Epithele typhae]|uniref:TFIID and SAGA subunit n=1 Tax=Epithele typhae TaxID=378194 RepID=UPI0020086ACA|nr:TFIID and SAGA subunit [Epithele typhae]KAH9944292.1 TFIID and SAGA subunit [Epithele typhae]
MSATPAASSPDGASPPASNPPGGADSSSSISDLDRMVLDYLRSRGHKEPEKIIEDLERDDMSVDEKGKQPETLSTHTISQEELVKQLAIFAEKPTDADGNALKDSSTALNELSKIGQPQNIQNLISSIGPVGAEEMLLLDPTDKHEGFRELEAWVDGSLDMYRPEFRPILFPIFCHFYLDLVQQGFREAAQSFYSTFSASLSSVHHTTLHHLSTITLPYHVQTDEIAQRFRMEKYTVRMSRSGFSLLIGWLTEGFGGEPTGAGDGFSGEKGKRGRAAVMRVVNNHLRFDVTTSSTTAVSQRGWEESTGFVSAVVPQTNGSTTDASAYNSAKGELKLGPAPISEELRTETERTLREQAIVDQDPGAQYDLHFARPTPPAGLISPALSDLPPHPPSFKTVDVKREVEKVRDARKRIRLDPSVLTSTTANSQQGAAVRARALPSICAYTFHDVGEGVPCCEFSADASLLAAGFSESYIRLWSLKGEKLKGMRSDFQMNAIRDASSLNKIRERGGTTTRKLIGHSGPVYSVAFDPIGGSAASPKYLLSSSADATARLWSLETMTNIVAYRGHQNPVWDVKWSPMGIYFATASRDRTARLWSTDRTSALRIYAGHLSDVNAVDFHPNSLYLGTASSDCTARLWDVQRGACVRVFYRHDDIVSTLAFSPDGRYLATAGEEPSIRLWDLGSGRCIKKMTGHTASIYSLAFSAESNLLVSGAADWTVRCWDIKASGGLATKTRENGATVNGASDETPHEKDETESNATTDLIATFPTKRTPIINVQFTPRNLCLVAGPYLSPELR